MLITCLEEREKGYSLRESHISIFIRKLFKILNFFSPSCIFMQFNNNDNKDL